MENPAPLPVKKKRPPLTEQQIENLRKGTEKMKALRIKREEKQKKIDAGEEIESSDEEPPKPIIKIIPKKRPERPVIEVPRKTRSDKGLRATDSRPFRYATHQDFENFKTSLLEGLKNPIRVEERIVEKPVETIVEKVVEKQVDKVLSGSALLDKLFFNR